MNPEQSELGKKTAYVAHYDPNLLFPIARKLNRDKIGISGSLPFFGLDYWNHYEVSWLNPKGKPIVALAEIIYPCDSEHIIESKSMKLYFNSFNNTRINDVIELTRTIQNDIETRIKSPAHIRIIPVSEFSTQTLQQGFEGTCIDDLDIECSEYQLNPTLLTTNATMVTEQLHSNLMKSNCLVTDQPDWGSVLISYHGPKIVKASLLRYIVSYRNTNEFSETCIERMFIDIMQHCKPRELTVYGRFTRRGGIDINPIRSTQKITPDVLNKRHCRQ